MCPLSIYGRSEIHKKIEQMSLVYIIKTKVCEFDSIIKC